MTNPGPRRLFPGAALFAALLFAAPAPAAVLSGRLVAAGSLHPVEGARVSLLETGQAQRTDTGGRFAFAGLSAGLYTLSTHHVAYADLERSVRLAEGAAAPLELQLTPALYRAEEIVVRSSRSVAGIASTPYAADAIGHDRLQEVAAPTLSDAVSRLPGVALSRDGTWETALSVRGLGRSNVVALVDNARIETSTDLSGGLSLVNPEDVERVEVMRSSGSVLFGSGALGGAVQMVTRRAEFSDAPRFGAEWTDGFTSADRGNTHYLAAESASRRHALRLSAGYDKAGDVTTPRGRLANSHFGDWSLNGSLGVRTLGRQSLVASYQRVQAEDTGIPGGSAFSATAVATYTQARRELVALEYVVPNPGSRVPLITARASRQQIVRRVNVVQSPVITLTPHAVHTTTSGQLEARIVPGHDHLLIAGAELWHRAVDSRRERWLFAQNRVVGERPIPRAAYMSGGVYAQDEWSLAPGRARLVLGARYDRSRTQNDPAMNPVYVISSGVFTTSPAGQTVLWPGRVAYDQSWSANAGLHVDLGHACGLSVLAATAFRSPSLEERYQYLDLGSSLHVGNPALAPERSVSLNAGARVRAGHTRLQADVFGNLLRDLVSEVPGTYEGRAAFVKANIGAARLYGYEVSAEERLHAHAALRASLAYVRGEDTRSHANLAQIAPLTGTGELVLDVPRAGTLHVTGTAAHAQGNPGAGETRTAGWTVWGANVTSAPLRAGTATFELRAGVENLLDRAYRLHLTTARGFVKLEPGRNAFVSATFTW
jgi:hemoglobin/transferrin/lactoferrin receptor protein